MKAIHRFRMCVQMKDGSESTHKISGGLFNTLVLAGYKEGGYYWTTKDESIVHNYLVIVPQMNDATIRGRYVVEGAKL